MEDRLHTLLQISDALGIPLSDVLRAAESIDIPSPDASTILSTLDHRLLVYALRTHGANATPESDQPPMARPAAQATKAATEPASPGAATIESVMARYDDDELEYRATFRWHGPAPLASAELCLIVLGSDGQTPLAIGDGGCEPDAASGESVDIKGEIYLDGLPRTTVGAPVRGVLKLYPGTPLQLLDLELPDTDDCESGRGSSSLPDSTFPLSITRSSLTHLSTSDDDKPEYQLCLLIHNRTTRPLPSVLVTALTSQRNTVISKDVGSVESLSPGEIRAVRLNLKYKQPVRTLRQSRVSVSVTPCDEPYFVTIPSIRPTRGARQPLAPDRPGALSLRSTSLFDSTDTPKRRRELDLSDLDDEDIEGESDVGRDDSGSRHRRELDLSGLRDGDPEVQDADDEEDSLQGFRSSRRTTESGRGSVLGNILDSLRRGRSSRPRRRFRDDEQL